MDKHFIRPDIRDIRGPLPRPTFLNLRAEPRLPSIESQTVAFVDYAWSEPEPINVTVNWAGFSVYLRYARQRRLTDELTVGECLAISTVDVPQNKQHRGWFWRYCQLCLGLVSDALVIENVINPALRVGLRQRPVFVEYIPESFVIRRTPDCPWPLRVFQEPTESGHPHICRPSDPG